MTISIASQETSEQQLDNEVVLSVEGVSKKFCRDLKRSLLYAVQDIATELVGIRQKSEKLRRDEFWALKDVSFQLRRGEALGLVGPNGSGKSTLLRIISGLIKPDSGFVEIKGRIAPLIALGAGFNPILTGRENIYANMSILGLSKKEIDERFEAVLDFAEIGTAIDAPVQTYSSGMAARLGFACAIYTEPDILLIDEVLAVGDIKFRAKCYRRLAKLREQGTSFILVSHNPHSILSICDRAMYLSKGNLIATGDTDLVMNRYEQDLFLNGLEKSSGLMLLSEKAGNPESDLYIIYLCFKDKEENIIDYPITGEPTYFCVGCKVSKKLNDLSLAILITEMSGENDIVLNLSAYMDDCPLQIDDKNTEIQLQMPYLGLKPGVYSMKVHIAQNSLTLFDAIESFRFTVKGNKSMNQCSFYQPRAWKVTNKLSYTQLV
jgi:lipopolysaccharide transport system ATP-binding protein